MNPAFSESGARDAFLDGAFSRILRISFVLAVAGTIAGWAIFDATVSAGFALGSAAAMLNLVWLHGAVAALVSRMLDHGEPASRLRITLSFLGRYALVALVAYAIFRGSAQAFSAFLIALPLPILAAMCEGAYEAFLNIKDSGSTDT
jgi:ATP synthase I subunit